MSDWKLLSDDLALGVRRYELDLDDEQSIIRTEYYETDNFLDATQKLRNESDGKRYGDMAHVASIPMHIWAREIAPRGDDQDFMKWFLNHPEKQGFRTKRGNL